MNIGVVGLGFVGLTLAMHLTKNKENRVYGFEINSKVTDCLTKGETHFYEPGLEDLLNISIGKTFFVNEQTTQLDCVFITVGTPLDKSTNTPNLKYIDSAIDGIIDFLRQEAIVFLRSTVAIGLSREVQEKLHNSGRRDLGVCFAPERTVEGAALEELEKLPQIFSADSIALPHCKFLLEKMNFFLIQADSLEAAEAAKLLSNTYRDINFSIANLFALICEDQGLSFNSIRRVAEFQYQRNNFGVPGFVSGPCLSKDSYIISSTLANSELASAVTMGRGIEIMLIDKVVEKITAHRDRNWVFTGLAFKGQPETSALRDSSVLLILSKLAGIGVDIRVHDFTVPESDLRDLPYPLLKTVEMYGVDAKKSAIFIGNNSVKYRKQHFETFIAEFLSRGGLVFDTWGILEYKHPSIISLGHM